jgi:transposase-like protein
MQEDKESWLSFIRHLKSKGLSGVRLVVTSKCLGLVEAVSRWYPKSDWQRCIFHFHWNILTKVSREKMADVVPMLKAIHAVEDQEAAMEKGASLKEKLLAMRLGAASKILEAGL